MMIVVGLGNPGEEYRRTRHNLGFMVLERAAGFLGAGPWREGERCQLCFAGEGEGRVALLKPLTFMNLSGEAVEAFLDTLEEEPPPGNLLAIADDAALEFGRLRFRAAGSCGGHNGLASVEAALGSREYARLRVGIGLPSGGAAAALLGHVLGEFSAAEQAALPEVLEAAARGAAEWTTRGVAWCQERYNGFRPGARAEDKTV